MSEPLNRKPPEETITEPKIGAELDPVQVSRELASKLPSLGKLPEGERIKVIATIQQAVQFSGPLPPPDMLKQYDQITPGLADRIVGMAEKAQTHEQDMDRLHLQSEIKAQGRDDQYKLLGQIWAIVVVCMGIGLIGWLGYVNQPWLAGVIGLGSVSSIAYMFINGRKSAEKPRPPDNLPAVKKKKR
jgi:uncharacterized membrane protein